MEILSGIYQAIMNFFSHFDPEIVIRSIAQVILLTMSAFFSGSEVALFSLSRLDLRKLRSTRDPTSEPIHHMLREPRSLIISILCGNESVNIASSANMAAILLLFFSEEETRWINLFVMVPVLLLVGEVTPKTFAVTFPTMVATKVTGRILPRWIHFIAPVRRAVRSVADRLTTWVVGAPTQQENILHTDEFRTLVEEGEATGVLDPREKLLIDNMLEASETEVIQIMTPATRMHFLESEKPLPQLLADFAKYQHPHMPVARGNRYNIIGFLEADDIQHLLKQNVDLSHLKITDIIRPAHFVPPGKKIDEMFDYFNTNNTWAAIVLGEYGEIYGIVTIADVLGFIFGGLSEKIDSLGLTAKADDTGERTVFTVAGDMNLEQFNDWSHIEIDIPDSLMTTSVGGYVFDLFDRLPAVGDRIEEDGVEFEVREMDNLRIKTLRVCRLRHKAEPGEEQEAVTEADADFDSDNHGESRLLAARGEE